MCRPRLRAFVDYLVQRFGRKPDWERFLALLQVLREELLHRLVEVEAVLLVRESRGPRCPSTMYWTSTPRFFSASTILIALRLC
jgi:hypothetical protein